MKPPKIPLIGADKELQETQRLSLARRPPTSEEFLKQTTQHMQQAQGGLLDGVHGPDPELQRIRQSILKERPPTLKEAYDQVRTHQAAVAQRNSDASR